VSSMPLNGAEHNCTVLSTVPCLIPSSSVGVLVPRPLSSLSSSDASLCYFSLDCLMCLLSDGLIVREQLSHLIPPPFRVFITRVQEKAWGQLNIPLGKNWLNQCCLHVMSTPKINVMTLSQHGKLIGFAKKSST
jgi:hypothetical protein